MEEDDERAEHRDERYYREAQHELAKTTLHYEFERLKLEHARIVAEQRRPFDEAVFKFADTAIKSLLILNGGAALAVIGFAAQAIANNRSAAPLENAVFFFGFGAALAVACAGLSYLTQRVHQMIDDDTGRFHNLFIGLNIAAIAIWFAGLAFFVIGVLGKL